MKKTLAILCLFALLGGCLAACGAPKPETLLAGQWKASAGSLEFKSIAFTPGAEDPRKGTVSLGMTSLVGGSYEVIPGQGKDARDMVKITYTLWLISTTRSYYFTVEGNTLNMQEENAGVTLTFTRESAVAAGTTG